MRSSYNKNTVGKRRFITFNLPDKVQLGMPVGAFPVELVIENEDGIKFANPIKWIPIYNESFLEQLKKDLEKCLLSEGYKGIKNLHNGIDASKEYMKAYKTIIQSTKATLFKNRAIVVEYDEKAKKFVTKNVPLNEKTIKKICSNNCWDIFAYRAKKAKEKEVAFKSYQDRKVARLAPRSKKDTEKDSDESYFYFQVPGCSIKMLGSISLLEYFKRLFTNHDFKETAIGSSKIKDLHSFGREIPKHDFKKETANPWGDDKK